MLNRLAGCFSAGLFLLLANAPTKDAMVYTCEFVTLVTAINWISTKDKEK